MALPFLMALYPQLLPSDHSPTVRVDAAIPMALPFLMALYPPDDSPIRRFADSLIRRFAKS